MTRLEKMLALARVEHPDWWRAWNWIEDHSEMLEPMVSEENPLLNLDPAEST